MGSFLAFCGSNHNCGLGHCIVWTPRGPNVENKQKSFSFLKVSYLLSHKGFSYFSFPGPFQLISFLFFWLGGSTPSEGRANFTIICVSSSLNTDMFICFSCIQLRCCCKLKRNRQFRLSSKGVQSLHFSFKAWAPLPLSVAADHPGETQCFPIKAWVSTPYLRYRAEHYLFQRLHSASQFLLISPWFSSVIIQIATPLPLCNCSKSLSFFYEPFISFLL